MPLSDRSQIDYVKSVLRRTYANDLPGLKNYGALIFQTATDEVVLTTGSFEGGSAGGQVKFNKMNVGMAIEELIAELDPAYVPPPQRSFGSAIQFAPDLT
jgi:hypothetical protein